MKLILAGSTGFIGKEVLHQALSHPSISSLVILSRRALPEEISTNPKVQVIILEDFMVYTPEVLEQLKDADGCIWTIGFPPPALKAVGKEAAKKVQVDYTRAAAEAFSTLTPEGKTFRFVLGSGQMAERDLGKKLWFLDDSRKQKGEMENTLLTQQTKTPSFQVSIMRPGGVVAKETFLPNLVVGTVDAIRVDELAAAMVGEAVGGEEGTRTLECGEVRRRGREILSRG